MEQYICNLCNAKLSSKKDIIKHQKTKKCQEIHIFVMSQINKFNNEITIYKNEIDSLTKEKNLLQKKIEEQETKIKTIQEKYEDLRIIVEKAATKSTNTVKNYNHNNYLNYISSEPIKFNELVSQVKQIVNCETVMYGNNEFHDHIVDNILKDKNGKDKVLCTDINRKNFTYKDETSGKLISDPELERLREQLRKGTDIKQIRKDLLEKLVTEYEENDCIGTDPYKQFSEIIQKLNFGTPFVDHVAKKTYIKTKNEIQNNIDEEQLSIILSPKGSVDDNN